jgi:hypothetical protein
MGISIRSLNYSLTARQEMSRIPLLQTSEYTVPDMSTDTKRTTNSKPIPHIPLPFKEVIGDVLKVKPPKKERPKTK